MCYMDSHEVYMMFITLPWPSHESQDFLFFPDLDASETLRRRACGAPRTARTHAHHAHATPTTHGDAASGERRRTKPNFEVERYPPWVHLRRAVPPARTAELHRERKDPGNDFKLWDGALLARRVRFGTRLSGIVVGALAERQIYAGRT